MTILIRNGIGGLRFRLRLVLIVGLQRFGAPQEGLAPTATDISVATSGNPAQGMIGESGQARTVNNRLKRTALCH
jgi:hypothetical protein